MYDKLSTLQESVTKVANFNGAGLDLSKGTRLDGMVARVLYSAASNASGSGTVVFSVEHSDDNSTFFALASGAADKITLTTTAQDGEIFIPFKTDKRYVRLVCTITGGTTPTITYESDVTFTNP